MSFLSNVGTPHDRTILECPKCKHQIEVLEVELRIPKNIDFIADPLQWGLKDNYHFICVKCNAEMSFLSNVETPHDLIILECPKGKHQIIVQMWSSSILHDKNKETMIEILKSIRDEKYGKKKIDLLEKIKSKERRSRRKRKRKR